MEWPRVKNIMLALLLLVNVLLIALWAGRLWGASQTRRAAQTQLVELLSQRGVAIEQEILPPLTPGLFTLYLRENADAQALLASSFLPDATKTSGGADVVYRGENGEVTFSSALDMRLHLITPEVLTDAPLSALASLLRKQGLSRKPELTTASSQDFEVITYHQRIEKQPVYNASVLFFVQKSGGEDNSETETPSNTKETAVLTGAEGTLLLGETLMQKNSEAPSVSRPLLLLFAPENITRPPVTEILALQSGYWCTPDVPGIVKLTPVWQLTTDAGVFYMDAYTGALVTGKALDMEATDSVES